MNDRITDSQLAALHAAALIDRDKRSPFLRAIYPELRRAVRRSVRPELRRLTDTDDLLQSTLGDGGVLVERARFGWQYAANGLGMDARWKALKMRQRMQTLRRGGAHTEERPDFEWVAGPARTPSRIVASADSKRCIRQGIAELPELEREVMQRKADGESTRVVAESLGLTVSEVRTLVGHAILRLGGGA